MTHHVETDKYAAGEGTSDWPLVTGDGKREYRKTITFSKAFYAPPKVTAAISICDVAQGANFRFAVRVENVKPDSFDMVFGTWADTKVYNAEASWSAFGDAP